MDIDFIRIAVTVGSFVLFLGLMAWTWSPKRREAMAAAERAPFEGEQ